MNEILRLQMQLEETEKEIEILKKRLNRPFWVQMILSKEFWISAILSLVTTILLNVLY